MSGCGENYHCYCGNIPDINNADSTVSLASVECVLRSDRARVVVGQILHKTVGAKKRVGQARGLNVLFRIAMPAREHGRRLDAQAPSLDATSNNGYTKSLNWFMTVGIDFPTVGPWSVTGRFAEDELTFVVWLAK